MSNRKFQVGDVVRCIDGCLNHPTCLIVGNRYRIADVSDAGRFVRVEGIPVRWYADRFVLVEQNKQTMKNFFIKMPPGESAMSRAIQTILFEHDLRWIGSGPKTHWFSNTSGYIRIDLASRELTNDSPKNGDVVYTVENNLPDILKAIVPRTTVEVVLNKNHKAVVSEDGIVVGCQTFPLSIVDDLQKAIDSLGHAGTACKNGLPTDFVYLGCGDRFKIKYYEKYPGVKGDSKYRRRGDTTWTDSTPQLSDFTLPDYEYALHKDSPLLKTIEYCKSIT